MPKAPNLELTFIILFGYNSESQGGRKLGHIRFSRNAKIHLIQLFIHRNMQCVGTFAVLSALIKQGIRRVHQDENAIDRHRHVFLFFVFVCLFFCVGKSVVILLIKITFST